MAHYDTFRMLLGLKKEVDAAGKRPCMASDRFIEGICERLEDFRMSPESGSSPALFQTYRDTIGSAARYFEKRPGHPRLQIPCALLCSEEEGAYRGALSLHKLREMLDKFSYDAAFSLFTSNMFANPTPAPEEFWPQILYNLMLMGSDPLAGEMYAAVFSSLDRYRTEIRRKDAIVTCLASELEAFYSPFLG
ncbi:MAG: hypothetical protein ABIH90_00310 [Candidatus Aenigmatarchaeota archaeon]